MSGDSDSSPAFSWPSALEAEFSTWDNCEHSLWASNNMNSLIGRECSSLALSETFSFGRIGSSAAPLSCTNVVCLHEVVTSLARFTVNELSADAEVPSGSISFVCVDNAMEVEERRGTDAMCSSSALVPSRRRPRIQRTDLLRSLSGTLRAQCFERLPRGSAKTSAAGAGFAAWNLDAADGTIGMRSPGDPWQWAVSVVAAASVHGAPLLASLPPAFAQGVSCILSETLHSRSGQAHLQACLVKIASLIRDGSRAGADTSDTTLQKRVCLTLRRFLAAISRGSPRRGPARLALASTKGEKRGQRMKEHKRARLRLGGKLFHSEESAFPRAQAPPGRVTLVEDPNGVFVLQDLEPPDRIIDMGFCSSGSEGDGSDTDSGAVAASGIERFYVRSHVRTSPDGSVKTLPMVTEATVVATIVGEGD